MGVGMKGPDPTYDFELCFSGPQLWTLISATVTRHIRELSPSNLNHEHSSAY